MSLRNLSHVALILSTVIAGSSGAVLHGHGSRAAQEDFNEILDRRSTDLDAAPGRGPVSTNPIDVLNRIYHGGHRIPDEVLAMVKRQVSDGVEVSEAELLQVIQDVQDIEAQLRNMLDEGSTGPGETTAPAPAGPDTEPLGPSTTIPDLVPTASSGIDTPDGLSPDGPSEGQDGPQVSAPIPDGLTSSIPGNLNPVQPAPTGPIDDGTADDDDDDQLDQDADDLDSDPVTWSYGTDCTSTLTLTHTEYHFDGPSTLETAFRGANETATPTDPPAITSDPVLEQATDVSGEAEQNDSEEEEPAAGAQGDAAPAGAAIQPSALTLRFPDEDSSTIVWRTISLPRTA